MKSSRNLLKRISAVSAASLLALTAKESVADIPKVDPTTEPPLDDHHKQSVEPILLTPDSIEGQLFADHSSHASHASHYSGASDGYSGGGYDSSSDGSGSYTPLPPPTPTPSTPYTPYTPGATAPSATPVQNIIQITFTNGATLIGTVISKNTGGIIFAALDGKNYKIPWTLLTPKTIDTINSLIQ